MSIKVLEPKVISQIAAGEVVERPASIVKELLENALDSGASQISVEIKNGGISLIRITDNGTGIPAQETELAFQRHATSKINNLEDLQRISTLGFRGEALPSIAAVAQIQMVTCAQGEAAGTYLSLDDGKIVQHESQARSPGTTITVQNLFRKIPARLKFLKSESTESGKIAAVVTQYALAFPEVRFSLIVEGKTALRTPGSGKLLDSIMAVYGLETARGMLQISNLTENREGEISSIQVTGLVGAPRNTRSNRDYLSFFVNRRWINNRMLTYAVEEAYHGLIMQGKHPVAVINITIPSPEIDINVHPSKTEIKFKDERAVFGAVQKAVRQTLVQSSPVPQVEETRPKFSVPETSFIAPSSMALPGKKEFPPVGHPDQPAPVPLISLPLLRVLGQMSRSYIAAEGPDGLYLIDQHAAHERIQFENIRQQRESGKMDVQGLLQPVTFEVDIRQAPVMSSHLDEIVALGFNIEPFGSRTYLVRAVPAMLRDKDWAGMLRESLDNPSSRWSENLAVTLACHSAIRAGQVLSDSEMRELIKQLEKTALPHTCPHGRPTMIQLSMQRIEKEFGRTP